MNFVPIDFSDQDVVPISSELNFVLQKEGIMLRYHHWHHWHQWHHWHHYHHWHISVCRRLVAQGPDKFDPLVVNKDHLRLILQVSKREKWGGVGGGVRNRIKMALLLCCHRAPSATRAV